MDKNSCVVVPPAPSIVKDADQPTSVQEYDADVGGCVGNRVIEQLPSRSMIPVNGSADIAEDKNAGLV